MSLLKWLDHRTGCRALLHEALYERIPGGARWRYVWGSTLTFAFFVQLITGIFLWMAYSPSRQTAWESVYFIQYEMAGGWLLRGIHHFMAQAMVVLLALHLLQVVIDGAYRAPREVNFWLGLILMQIVLALALTGYLLPWDQKGYWATIVATNLMGLAPGVGESLQKLVVGGSEYGHHTLTRFFALHAGVLPGLLIFFLVLHLALFRRHGICHKTPSKKPDTTFWPEQVLRDAVACLAVLVIVGLLCIHFDVAGYLRGEVPGNELGAELTAPADATHRYDARPEWYFLFLFQLLKFAGTTMGAFVLPGLIFAILFLMPIIGRTSAGHRFNVAFIIVLFLCIAGLTGAALWEDYRSRWTDGTQFTEIAELSGKLDSEEKIKSHFDGDETKIAEYRKQLKAYRAYRKSLDHLAEVERAEADAHRVRELAARPTKIPPQGALALMADDPLVQGPRLFANNCAMCHSYFNPAEIDSLEAKDQLAKASAPNLYGFGSREWIAGLLNPKQITKPMYFGSTAKYKELKAKDESMEMVDYVLGDVSEWPKEEVEQVVAALSAQANLPSQKEMDERDKELIAEGMKLLADDSRCASCHPFKPELPPGDPKLAENDTGYPDLTHYASRDWLIGMVCNAADPRFYGDRNDRMPAFFFGEGDPRNTLSRRQIELIVDWLRGDYYRPEAAKTAAEQSDK